MLNNPTLETLRGLKLQGMAAAQPAAGSCDDCNIPVEFEPGNGDRHLRPS